MHKATDITHVRKDYLMNIRQELRWKGKRDHHCRLRWTREWLDDTAIPLVVNHGSWLVDQRVRLVLDDILDVITDKAEKKATEI